MAVLAMQVGAVCAPSLIPRTQCSSFKARRSVAGNLKGRGQFTALPPLKLRRARELAIGPAQQTTRSKALTVCQAAAIEATPAVSPVKAIVVAIQLAVVNTYLNIFGRFETGIRLLVDLVFPSKIKNIFEGLFQCYKEQVAIGNNGDMKIASKKTSAVFREMIRAYAGQMLGTPYEFPSYHTAIREPIDYYKLGNDYVGTLVDYQRSVLGNAHHWDDIQKKIDAGENVIFFANHQSEADAAFIPLLTQKTHPGLGEKVVYLAGDRVVSDLMSKPFSMGRNLLCIHSKKHMAADDSTTKSKKMRANIKTLKEMEKLLKAGGTLLWIAPSGGRDRKSADGVLSPDPFDPDSIELMKKFGTKKGVKKTTFYPMAMATYDVMPPPVSVGGDIGEKRIVNYTGCGISLGDPIDVTENGDWAKGVAEDDYKQALAEYTFEKVSAEYSMICGCMGTGDGFETPISCTRPWL